jgi:hypothetical protein
VKFKTVFILFNSTIAVFLAVLCLTPGLVLGYDFVLMFWQTNWFLFLLLAVILVGFDSYFIANWKLYGLLEREDWPALVHYLEDRVIRRGKFSPRLVRLLANTYLVLSDSPSVLSLENKAAIAKPSLVESNVLVFGTARILGRDIRGAVHFFGSRLDRVKPALKQWVRWYYGFSLMLDKQYRPAADEFSLLAENSPDGVVVGLASFFLNDIIVKALPDSAGEFNAAADKGRARVKKNLRGRKDWNRAVSALSTEIHAAALAMYLEEAGNWLYNFPGEKTKDNV